MPRLYRPSIPVEVKCRVALRQLGEMFIDSVIEHHRHDPKQHGIPEYARRSHAKLLDDKLGALAELLNCPVEQLRLDHDPALENRTKRQVKHWFKGKGYREITEYDPQANDPNFLRYRPHAAEFEGSHHVKTNIRGDHGQFPDNTIAKRERRRQRKVQKQQCSRCFARYRIPPSKLCGRCQKVAMKYRDKVKRKWPKRPFQTRSKHEHA